MLYVRRIDFEPGYMRTDPDGYRSAEDRRVRIELEGTMDDPRVRELYQSMRRVQPILRLDLDARGRPVQHSAIAAPVASTPELIIAERHYRWACAAVNLVRYILAWVALGLTRFQLVEVDS